MKTLFRLIFTAIFIPLIIAMLIGFAVWTFIPQEEIRRYAAEEIGKKINRQLEIGRIHFAWNGIEIDRLRLSEPPRFSAGTLFEAKGVRLGWSVRALWQGFDVRRRTFTRSSGSFFIKDFRNPHYVAKNFDVRWSLSGLDQPAKLDGWAKLNQGPGAIQNLDKLVAKSPSAKVALAPVMVIMNIDRTGILLGLPDLRYWALDSIQGNYVFDDGLMTVKEFSIKSVTLNMDTTGTIDLGSGKLALDTKLHAPKRGGMGMLDIEARITGTTAKPQVDVSTLRKKAFKATLNSLFRKL